MVCSQKRRCHMPRSPFLIRLSLRCSVLGRPLEKRALIFFHLVEKSESPAGNVQIQCRCSGKTTIAFISNGISFVTIQLHLSPTLEKGVEGGFEADTIIKSPLIPLFQSGRSNMITFFSNIYFTLYSYSHFSFAEMIVAKVQYCQSTAGRFCQPAIE